MEKGYQRMKNWAEDDRPRERLAEKGRQALSDAELLSILIGSGSSRESALDLSKRILNACGNELRQLSKLGIPDLKEFKGIGEAKAVTIIAALELGRRRKEAEVTAWKQLQSSEAVFELMQPVLSDLAVEEFWMLFLNRGNRLIRKEQLSKGGITGTVVDVRVVFKSALQYQATSLIICHNHPSGNLNPSEADLQITKKIKDIGKLMEIQLVDHLIISDNGYFSLADNGLI